MSMKSQGSNDGIASFLGGFIVGTAVGVVVGIFTAPKPGAQVREDVWGMTRQVSNEFTDPDGKTRRFIEKARFQLEDQIGKYRQANRDGKLAKAKRKEALDSGVDYQIEKTGYFISKSPQS